MHCSVYKYTQIKAVNNNNYKNNKMLIVLKFFLNILYNKTFFSIRSYLEKLFKHYKSHSHSDKIPQKYRTSLQHSLVQSKILSHFYT